MSKISNEAKRIIRDIRPALVATASRSGKPNVSAKGSFRFLDDETVVFAEVASPRTIANIKENPQVSIICLDATQRKSCRIWGTPEVISSGKLFNDICKEYAAKKIDVKNVVKVAVDEVEIS